MFQPGTRFACRSGWLLCTPLSSTATTMPAPVEVFQAVEAPILEICHSCDRIGSFVVALADTMRSTSANFTWGLRASALATASSFALAGNSTTCTSSPRTLPSDLPLWDIRTPAKSSSERPAFGATRMRLFAQLPHGERSIAADGDVIGSGIAACATFALVTQATSAAATMRPGRRKNLCLNEWVSMLLLSANRNMAGLQHGLRLPDAKTFRPRIQASRPHASAMPRVPT